MPPELKIDADWWTVLLPVGWTSSQEDSCLSFRARPPLGVLQVSAARKPTGAITVEEAYEFAQNDADHPRTIEAISTPHASGLYSEHTTSGLYWREWWLFAKATLVLVT